MDKETVREQLRDYAEMTERAIDSYLPETECLQKNVILAARHSLTAGGKRLRPALVMEFCRVSGGEAASALPPAIPAATGMNLRRWIANPSWMENSSIKSFAAL